MVSKKKLKRENKTLKKQLKELKELQALTQSNFLDLIAYKRNNESKMGGQPIAIVDIGHRTRDRIKGPNELVFGQTCGGKSPVVLSPLYGARTGRMQSGTSFTEGVSKAVGRIELVRTLLRMPNAVPHIKGADDRVSLIEPHYASIVKQLEKNALPILDAHLSGTKLIDFDNIPQEVFNYIWIVSNEQNGNVNPVSTIGSFLLEKTTSGKSLKELNKEMGSPSISEMFPDSSPPSIEECDERMMQESKGFKSHAFDVPYSNTSYENSTEEQVKPNKESLVRNIVVRENDNIFARNIPVQEESLLHTISKAGVHISVDGYTPIVFDYLHNLSSKKPLDKFTTKEQNHHMRNLIGKVNKQANIASVMDLPIDVNYERGLLITPNGDVEVITILKKQHNLKPFEV